MTRDPEAENWGSVRRLFFEALDLPADQREAFVLERTEGDEETRGELRSLLAAHGDGDGALETLQRGEVRRSLEQILVEGMRGVRVGDWELRRVVASGGMGIVYEAQHTGRHQSAALKVLRSGARSDTALRRFRDEADILARLRHPAIARVYEVGTHRIDDGTGERELPYFAMEYVAGARPILEHARSARLSREERLRLFATICDAVHHAHQRGVIHRDLKSDNVLVGDDGPRVVDFGIARLEDSEAGTRPTRTGQLLGTLRCMSPEQLAGDPHEVDVRSDVYALGVLLYELLLDRSPYELDGKPAHEVARIIREDDPLRPLSVDPRLPAELDWVLCMTLQKEPGRRYASVAHLQADVERFLEGRPLEAGPPRLTDLVRRFVARHRLGVAAASVVFLALLAGTAAMAFGLSEARRERDRAQTAADSATAIHEFLTEILSAGHLAHGDPDLRVIDLIEAAALGLEGRFDGQPLVRASVHRSVGLSFQELGFYPEARRHLQSALDLRGEHGPAGEAVAESRLDLAVLLRRDGDLAEAERLLDATVEEHLELFGSADLLTLNAEFERAELWRLGTRIGEAIDVFERVWVQREEELGPEDIETLLAARSLGQSLTELGRIEEARARWRGAIERSGATQEPLAVRTRLQLLGDLASLERASGQLAVAEGLARQAYEGWRSFEGESGASFVTSRQRLVGILVDVGKQNAAESILLDGIYHGLTNDLEWSLTTLECRLDLAHLYQRAGQIDHALRETEFALKGLRDTVGEDHPTTRRAAESLMSLNAPRDG